MTSRTAAGLLAAAALALAGCGAGGDGTGTSRPTTARTGPAQTTATPPAASRTGSGVPGGALTSPPAAGVGNAGELPAGFPLPPGARVGPVAVGGDAITATLTVPSGKQVYDFWRQRLPGAGYAVQGAEMVGGIGEITFAGRGCAAGSQLGIDDGQVTLECRRG